MESAERKKRVARKSHVLATTYAASSSSATANGREEHSLTENASAASSFYRFGDESETLENLGISIADDATPTFERASPEQVSDFYKSLGEWQNVLPKTDYTYSPASKHYRHKINGTFPVIPNMSRRDIWKNREVIDNEINSFCARNYRSEDNRAAAAAAATSGGGGIGGLSSVAAKSSRWFAGKFSGVTQRAPIVVRNTYVKTLRRFRRFSWTIYDHKLASSPVVSPTASSTANSGAVWRNLLLAAFVGFLLYFVASSSGGGVVVAPGEFVRAENVARPFVKLFSCFYSLVVSIYELTCSSTTFLLSMISLSGKRALDAACAPVYKFASLLWPSYDPAFDQPRHADADAERERARGDYLGAEQHIDRLFRRLLDENTARLIKTVVGSEDFANFVDDRLVENARERRRRDDALETTFERKLAALEAKMANAGAGERNDLDERIRVLRAEIAAKESRIETEIMALLAAVVELEKGASFDELKRKFASLFRSVESAHARIDKLSREFGDHAKNASDTFDTAFERSKDDLKHDLRLSVEELVARKLREWKNSAAKSDPARTERRDGDLEDYVKQVVKKALEVYDADKTGQADFALESQGGIILSTRCTETKTANAQFSILGIPLWHTSRSPRTVIQPGVHPGECWAFPGSTGYLVIQLSERIVVTGFTLEHIPRSLAANGTIDSAPKDFSVWALRWESDPEPKALGAFRFEVDGPSLQYFEAVRLPEPYQIVELKILSNHGKIDYTCLYRFRVHGIPT